MDSSLPTLPTSSLSGSKNTTKKVKTRTYNVELPDLDLDVYQRQGLALPTSIAIDKLPRSLDGLTLSVPLTAIDIKTALAEGYLVTAIVDVYGSFERDIVDGRVDLPVDGEELLGNYKIILNGYDNQTKLFTFIDLFDNSKATIPFDYILDRGLTIGTFI